VLTSSSSRSPSLTRPVCHQREPVQRASNHLVVDRTNRLSNANRFNGRTFGGLGIAVVEQGKDRRPRGEKGMLR
jgi:hypothetical protein